MRPAYLAILAVAFVSGAASSPVDAGDITLQAWTTTETDHFPEGIWNPQSGCCGGAVDWTGNTLTLDYRQAYNSTAWASAVTIDSQGRALFMPIPDRAIGVFFEVFSTTSPTFAVFQIDQGLSCEGPCFDSSATWNSSSNGFNPSPNGDLLSWTFDRGGVGGGTGVAPTVATANGVTSVYAWFDDPLLFTQRSGELSFYATSNVGIDGYTFFQHGGCWKSPWWGRWQGCRQRSVRTSRG